MLKLPITYDDLDGNKITETFYFNLNVAEVAEMNEEFPGGLETYLQQMIEAKDGAIMITAFKKIVQKAYGVRSSDGKRFIKSPELWEEFTQTNAFGRLFFDLITDAEKNSEFIVGILPGDFNEKMAKLKAQQEKATTVDLSRPGGRALAESLLTGEEKEETKKIHEYTDLELLQMPEEEFNQLIRKNKGNVPQNVLQVGMQRRFRE